jgi:NAD(P)-dependent dehydrogenase (short-subunit alcohol dehydrogenase family)
VTDPRRDVMGISSIFDLTGKTGFVTGGSEGLGKAMASALAEAGANIVIASRDYTRLENASREIRRFGTDVKTIQGDLSTPAGAESVARKALEEAGRIDILINNVGGRTVSVPTEDLSLEDWQNMIDLNLTHCFICSKIIGREMVKRRKGKIINNASMSGFIANKGVSGRTYETAKSAVVAFTKALAADWAPYGVNVNAIAPGYFLTEPNRQWFIKKPELRKIVEESVPMGRMGQPEEIGGLAVYLASDASDYMTGSVIIIDGGYTLW